MTSMPHPADWKRMSEMERMHLAVYGVFDDIDWRLARVAHLVGVNEERLDWIVEAEHGWEPHDEGYLHKVVEVAGAMRSGRLTAVDAVTCRTCGHATHSRPCTQQVRTLSDTWRSCGCD